jgi:hypothetical protein
MYMQDVTEKCGQHLDTSSTYKNIKKCPCQYVSGNINLWVIAERMQDSVPDYLAVLCKMTLITSITTDG